MMQGPKVGLNTLLRFGGFMNSTVVEALRQLLRSSIAVLYVEQQCLPQPQLRGVLGEAKSSVHLSFCLLDSTMSREK